MLAPLHFSSASAEHYTPNHVLELVYTLFGEVVDLDPCADPGRRVHAREHYTADRDGLARPWHGYVFMNPPYGRELFAWVSKALHEVRLGRAHAVVALLPARTDTRWFDALRDCPICFVRGRLRFIGNKDAAPFPSCLALIEQRPTLHARFVRTFSNLGTTWLRTEAGVRDGAA